MIKSIKKLTKEYREAHSESYKKTLTEKGWTLDFNRSNLEKLEPLKKKLLLFGGWAVVLFYDEPHLDEILDRGLLISGKSALKVMDTNNCHGNAARLFLTKDVALTLMTGYALTNDGLWRQHSWIYDDINKKVIETTVKRAGYFGFSLNDLESLKYCFENIHNQNTLMTLISSKYSSTAIEKILQTFMLSKMN